MEKEVFLTGYCRQLDQSRMVAVVADGGTFMEADCCYGSCPYEPNCVIAEKIRDFLSDT